MSYQRDGKQNGSGESRISNIKRKKSNSFKTLNIRIQNKCITQFLKI